MDISKHTTLQQCHMLGMQIEACGASEGLTKASAMLVDLGNEIEKLVDARDEAIFTLRMVDNNIRVDAGEKLHAWDGDFVLAEIRRLLELPAGRSVTTE